MRVNYPEKEHYLLFNAAMYIYCFLISKLYRFFKPKYHAYLFYKLILSTN